MPSPWNTVFCSNVLVLHLQGVQPLQSNKQSLPTVKQLETAVLHSATRQLLFLGQHVYTPKLQRHSRQLLQAVQRHSRQLLRQLGITCDEKLQTAIPCGNTKCCNRARW
jgi:hypothetical protein